MHSIYVTYINFCSTNYTRFYLSCNSINRLYATTYHTAFGKKVVFIVDEPIYTWNR